MGWWWHGWTPGRADPGDVHCCEFWCIVYSIYLAIYIVYGIYFWCVVLVVVRCCEFWCVGLRAILRVCTGTCICAGECAHCVHFV